MKEFKRIVLIGFRGTGKTTIAKQLAEMLGWPRISSDEMIEQKIGMVISDFVAKEGWPAFRKVETAVIQQISTEEQAVIDCGGGVIENPRNMAALSNQALIVWVDAGLEDIFDRLNQSGNRPLLTQGDLRQDIQTNYERRKPLYQRHSGFYVNTSKANALEVCREIVKLVF